MTAARRSLIPYLSLMAGAALLGTAKYAVFAKVLSPGPYGLYSLVITTTMFVVYAGSFGANEGLLKLGALAHGEHNHHYIRTLRNTAIACGAAATAICGCLFAVGVRLFVEDSTVANALILAGPLAVATIVFNLADSFLRVTQRITEFAALLFFRNLIVLAVGWTASVKFGPQGVLWTELFACALLAAGLLAFESKDAGQPRAPVDLKVFRELIRNGLPRLSAMLISLLAISVDRWVLAAAVGFAALGRYSFAMILHLVALTVTGLVTNVLGPKWLSAFGKSRDTQQLFYSIRSVALRFIGIAFGLAIPGSFLVVLMLERFYPQYAGADMNWTLGLVFLGTIFNVVMLLFDWFFVGSSNERYLVTVALISLAMAGALLVLAYYGGFGIIVYAGIFCFTRVCGAAMYYGLVRQVVRRSLVHPQQMPSPA